MKTSLFMILPAILSVSLVDTPGMAQPGAGGGILPSTGACFVDDMTYSCLDAYTDGGGGFTTSRSCIRTGPGGNPIVESCPDEWVSVGIGCKTQNAPYSETGSTRRTGCSGSAEITVYQCVEVPGGQACDGGSTVFIFCYGKAIDPDPEDACTGDVL